MSFDQAEVVIVSDTSRSLYKEIKENVTGGDYPAV